MDLSNRSNPPAAMAALPRERDGRVRWTTADGVAAVLVVAAAFVVFVNSLANGWILDDHHQVLRNRLIQEWPLYWRALTSDVWAFSTGDGRPGSNYWRPTFVAWNIGLWQIAGPGLPLVWHLANVLLHAMNTFLCLRMCRLLGVGVGVSAAIALIFACHPTRTESVAWVGGATDVVLGFFVLLTLIAFLRSARASDTWVRRRWFLLGCLVYLPALGSKEVSVLLPLPIAVIGACSVAAGAGETWWALLRRRVRAGVSWAFPLAMMGAGYVAMRTAVLAGGLMKPNHEVATIDGVLSAPAVALWYLGKAAWPHPVQPMYDFDVVTMDNVTLWRVALPALGCAALAAAWLVFVLWPRRQDPWAKWVGPGAAPPWPGAPSPLVPWFGAALFVSMLAPAMNLAAFGPDQPVHDRYLYVPLIGLMLVVLPVIAALARRVLGERPAAAAVVPLCAVALAAPLAWETVGYNAVWSEELRLWSKAVELEPRSALSHRLKGLALQEEGRLSEARKSFEEAVRLQTERAREGRTPLDACDSMIAIASIDTELGDPAAGERRLREVWEMVKGRMGPEASASLAVHLSITLDRQGRTAEASDVLREAMKASPRQAASLGDKLAVCLYKQGRREEAQRVLEDAVKAAFTDPIPNSAPAIFRLGMLYAEQGRKAEAKRLLEQFLLATRTQTHRAMLPLREQAGRMLKTLEQPGR